MGAVINIFMLAMDQINMSNAKRSLIDDIYTLTAGYFSFIDIFGPHLALLFVLQDHSRFTCLLVS